MKIKKKTHKSTSKRFALTGAGKLKHNPQGGNHLKLKKNKAQKIRVQGVKTLTSNKESIKVKNLMNA